MIHNMNSTWIQHESNMNHKKEVKIALKISEYEVSMTRIGYDWLLVTSDSHW